jgi:hypothetical protein
MRVADHKIFYCPNGHRRWFPGKTEADNLREQLKEREQRLEWANDQAEGHARRADAAERSLSATRGVVTKMKKRVGVWGNRKDDDATSTQDETEQGEETDEG